MKIQKSPTSRAVAGFIKPDDPPKAKVERRRPDQQKLAKLLAQGGTTYKDAMLQSGYSESVACQGRSGIPDAVWKLVPGKAKKLMDLGKQSPDTYRKLVLGRLAENTISGKDGGVMSAKALGSTKELDMFRTESQVGVIVVQF